jgi:hypothetical protein
VRSRSIADLGTRVEPVHARWRLAWAPVSMGTTSPQVPLAGQPARQAGPSAPSGQVQATSGRELHAKPSSYNRLCDTVASGAATSGRAGHRCRCPRRRLGGRRDSGAPLWPTEFHGQWNRASTPSSTAGALRGPPLCRISTYLRLALIARCWRRAMRKPWTPRPSRGGSGGASS